MALPDIETLPTRNSMQKQTICISDLPECVLLRIFHFVDIRSLILVIRKTCRFWNYLSYDRSLWKILKLDNGGFGEKIGDDSFLKMLAPISDLVEEIVFGFTMLLTDESFMHKDVFLSNIKSLDFSLTNVTTGAIVYLTEKYPKLTSLNLNHCSYINIYRCLDYVSQFTELQYLSFEDFACPADDNKLNAKILKTFQCCQNLKYCDIYATELSDKTLAGIFECSPKLKELDLTGADKLTHLGFQTLKKDVHCLTHLSIAYTMIDDKGLQVIAENSPKLKSLNIMSCVNISDVGIGYVATNCKELESFLVNKTDPEEKGCLITSAGLETLALGCCKLKTLCMNYCLKIDNKCIVAVASNCRGLRELRLAGCLSITDLSLEALGEHSRYLKDLEVSECSQITSKGISKLMAGCRWLQCLTLESCHLVSDILIKDPLEPVTSVRDGGLPSIKSTETVSDILINDPLKPASSVGAGGLPTIKSTETVSDILINDPLKPASSVGAGEPPVSESTESTKPVLLGTEHQQTIQTELESTTVVSTESSNARVTINRLTELEKHSHLQSLHLSFCTRITNDTIIELSKHCPDLQQLSLRGCYRITDIAISSLVSSCKFLRILDLSGESGSSSMKISNVALSAIANESKHIERLMVSKNKLINLSGLEVLFVRCKSLESLELTVGEPLYTSFSGVISLVNNIKDRVVRIVNHTQIVANKQSGTLHIEFYPNPERNIPDITGRGVDVDVVSASATQ